MNKTINGIKTKFMIMGSDNNGNKCIQLTTG